MNQNIIKDYENKISSFLFLSLHIVSFKKEKEILFLKSILESQDRCKLYIYGGAVRDALLNNTIRDVDAKTNCPFSNACYQNL